MAIVIAAHDPGYRAARSTKGQSRTPGVLIESHLGAYVFALRIGLSENRRASVRSSMICRGLAHLAAEYPVIVAGVKKDDRQHDRDPDEQKLL